MRSLAILWKHLAATFRTSRRVARGSSSRASLGRATGVAIALIVIMVLLTATTDTFGRHQNLLDISRQMAIVGLMTIGLTVVLAAGQIDLSMGSIFGLAGMVAAALIDGGADVGLAVLAALAIGSAAGVVNGVLSAYLGLSSFIVTLGMLQVLRGLALVMTDGAPIGLYGLEGGFLDILFFLGQGRLFGFLPMQFVVLVAIAVVVGLALRHTRWGLQVFASGGNRTAAYLAGVPVARVQTAAFVVSGVLAASAALLSLGFIGSFAPTAGTGIELTVFAAAVLGGASLFGGEGSVIGAVLGATLLSVINNGLILLGVSPFWQLAAIGAITILAVGVSTLMDKRRG